MSHQPCHPSSMSSRPFIQQPAATNSKRKHPPHIKTPSNKTIQNGDNSVAMLSKVQAVTALKMLKMSTSRRKLSDCQWDLKAFLDSQPEGYHLSFTYESLPINRSNINIYNCFYCCLLSLECFALIVLLVGLDAGH